MLDTKEYLTYYSIYIKVKNRQNWSIAIEFRIGTSFGKESWVQGGLRDPFGDTEMWNMLWIMFTTEIYYIRINIYLAKLHI